MKKPIALALFALAMLGSAQELKRGHDVAHVTDVSVPQPAYQVISPDQEKQLYTDAQALTDIQVRLGSIDKSIADIKADVKTLTETNVIVKFLVVCVQITVPGLLIAAFTVWLAHRPDKKKPRQARAT